MSTTVSSTASWVGAVGTCVLGITGLAFTWWQWWANGFRPQLTAEIDARREAIRVRITNKGRAAGVIGRLAVTDDEGVEVEQVTANGYAEGCFRPTRLSGLDYMEVVFECAGNFCASNRVSVDAGKVSEIRLSPVDVGLAGTDSLLPPASSQWQAD
jgi:hypothetical protein